MSKIFFDISISLDGYIAGVHRGPDNPLGDGGLEIHEWMFRQKAFGDTHGIESGLEDTAEGDLIRAVFARTGAYIMGKRMFEEGEANWPEDLFKANVFVLTHERRAPWVQQGDTTFHFVNDGIESALELARSASGSKDIRIQGGAETIRQYLNAELIDEFTIHIAPVLLGQGLRLFNQVGISHSLSTKAVSHAPLATHITYTFEPK